MKNRSQNVNEQPQYETVYLFKGFPDLHCNIKGQFFVNDKPIKKRYRPGQLYLTIKGRPIGIKTLRSLAMKADKVIDVNPL